MLIKPLAIVAMLVACSTSLAAEAPESNTCLPEAWASHGGSYATASDGVRIWYRLAGREGAPVIAFLHGGPGYNSFTFEKGVGALLERNYRVLYLDQRGCGRSTFDGPSERYGMERTIADVDHLRELIGVDRLVIAGHSFGGAVAAEYAARYPSRTAAVIMIDTSHDLGRALDYQVQYIDSIADETFEKNAQHIHEIAKSPGVGMAKLGKMYAAIGRIEAQGKLFYADPENQARMEALDRESGLENCTSNKAVGALAAQGYLTKAVPSVAKRLDAPTLLIAGSKSHVIGKDNIRAAAEVWGARLEWIDAGHFVYFERPEEFVRVTEKFLNEAGVGAKSP